MNSSLVSYSNEEIPPFYIGSAYSSCTRNGDILATAVDSEVVLTNLVQNEVVETFAGDGGMITCLQITPDGSQLAILSDSQQVQIYNISNSEVSHSIKLPSMVYSTAVDKTSTLFGFGGADGLIQVWDIDNGYITHSLKGHADTITCLNFFGELNSNKWYLLSGDKSGYVKIWDLVKRKCISTLHDHNSPVRGVEISEDFKYFVSGGRDNILNIYEVNILSNGNIKFKTSLEVPTKQSIESCGFINCIGNEKESNGYYIYFGGDESYLQVYDFINKLIIGTSEIPLETTEELMVRQILKLEDSKLCMILTDETIKFFDLRNNFIRDPETHLYNFQDLKTFAGNHGIIADLSFVGPDLDKVALATNAPALRIINPFKNKFEVEILQGHTDVLNCLDVSENGLWILTGSKDNDARLWKYDEELKTFKCLIIFKGHQESITTVKMSKLVNNQPTFILTASTDLTIKKWDLPKKLLKSNEEFIISTSSYTRKAHDKDINSLDLSPNDEWFATGSYDKTGKIWNVMNGETIGILRGHKRGIWKIKFCPFDKLILTCSSDNSLKLWSLETFNCIRTFEGHTNAVLDCEFINRRQILTNDISNELDINFKKNSHNEIISAGADGLIKIWNLKSGEIEKTLDEHDERIWSICSKKNGEWIISADNNSIINLWKDNTIELIKEKQKNDKQLVEQQQSLQNYIREKNWEKAFKLALKLNHPMKLYNVLKSSIQENDDESILGNIKLDSCIKNLTDDELKLIFEKSRSWNTNFKFFEISQKLTKCILQFHSIDKLIEIPGLIKIIDGILPYNSRHYQRIDGMIEDSYILDYTIQEMDKLLV